jgi:hypothetical protein
MVVDAETGAISSYALSNEAYTEDELECTLRSAGLDALQSFPSLRGTAQQWRSICPVGRTTRSRGPGAWLQLCSPRTELCAWHPVHPATMKARLMRSARKVEVDAATTGAGVVDIQAALLETSSLDSAPSSRLARSEEANIILIEDTARLWGDDHWSAGFIWNDAIQDDDPLLLIQGSTVLLNDD